MKIETSFLISGEDTQLLTFSKVQDGSFNFIQFQNKDTVTNDLALLFKQKSNSCVISVTQAQPGNIELLKLTNQSLMTWDDLWLDSETGISVDPLIESINLQRNSLLYVNFNLKRTALKHINLEGNIYLKSFTGSNLPNLETLDFENCINLEVVNLGLSKNIRSLSLKNCRLTEEGLERTLSSFIPTKTASANIFPGTLPIFRKKYETLLDLRGNDINWGNKRIASKIRLLVTNNWLVLWDNPPPTSVIPIQMYAFFPKNISDTSIQNYYGQPQIQPGSLSNMSVGPDTSVPLPPEPSPVQVPVTTPVPQSQPQTPSVPQSQPQAPTPSQPQAPAPSQPQPPSQPSPPSYY